MYPYIETYLGSIGGVIISVISNNNETQSSIIDTVLQDSDTRMFEFNCMSDETPITDMVNGKCVAIQCTLPRENRFGITDYTVIVEANLFEVIYVGLKYGFYDRLIKSAAIHYVQENHFSYGFKQATKNYKHLYENKDMTYWGDGLQELI